MRTQSLAFVLVAALAGCGSAGSTRTVTGELRGAAPGAMVVAQSAQHQQFSSSVSSTGRFTLQLPTGASYALAVGSARVDWPTATGAAHWARLGGGATLDLGHVTRQSDGHFACDHQGSDDDHCDRDDGGDGGDDDHGDDDHGGDDDHDRDGGDDGDHHACDGGGFNGGGGSGGADLGGIK